MVIKSLFVFLPFSLSFFLSISLSFFLSFCLAPFPSCSLSCFLSIFLSFSLSCLLSICPSICLSIYLSFCFCLSVCLSVFPSFFSVTRNCNHFVIHHVTMYTLHGLWMWWWREDDPSCDILHIRHNCTASCPLIKTDRWIQWPSQENE